MRSLVEQRFASVVCEKEVGGMSFTIKVDDRRWVTGLSRGQADEVMEALRVAMHRTAENTMWEVRRAIGLER